MPAEGLIFMEHPGPLALAGKIPTSADPTLSFMGSEHSKDIPVASSARSMALLAAAATCHM